MTVGVSAESRILGGLWGVAVSEALGARLSSAAQRTASVTQSRTCANTVYTIGRPARCPTRLR